VNVIFSSNVGGTVCCTGLFLGLQPQNSSECSFVYKQMYEGQLYIRIQSGMFKLSIDVKIPLPLSLQPSSNPYAGSIFQYKI
jgi:hypothetical protein